MYGDRIRIFKSAYANTEAADLDDAMEKIAGQLSKPWHDIPNTAESVN